ncbi:YdcF family protein [Paenibacillus antri]|uniref:YdcF family protein n=1 Tax=Paenibacillus antri TaxID=2582848 RepID=A0A5R9G4Q2_9BACL|nr:YdcF family protein [Paenibacillus antri]TLS50751.1 YdcF family protein [Paenibacillus antri]
MWIVVWTLIVLVGLLLVPALYFGWMHSATLEEGSRDALIVLGQRTENEEIGELLRERLDTAVRLFERHRYRFLILSGGAVGSERSEAEKMQDYLISRGVPKDKMILETLSRNTVQNIAYCRTLLRRFNLDSCLFISNSFHIRRMKYIAEKLNVNAEFYAARRPRSILCKQWKLTFQEIRAYRLSLPWIERMR